MLDVVTFGETMVAMTPEKTGSLKYINKFSKHIAGAESNFAIAIKRLGFKSGWISKLGNDPLGDFVEFFIRGEGVDVSRVERDSRFPTGLMVKELHSLKEPKVYYYRNNSAANLISPADIEPGYIKQAKFLHLTGITPAISESCKKAFFKALNIARENEVKVLFDPNLRLKLWKNKKKMKEVILNIIPQVDILLPGIEEGKMILGLEDPEEIVKSFYNLMSGLVVLKMGKRGALFYNGEDIIQVPAYKVEKVIDSIGAGDAFAAGLTAGLLRDYSIKRSVELANIVAAHCITVKGDIEGLPTWQEIEVMQGHKEVVDR